MLHSSQSHSHTFLSDELLLQALYFNSVCVPQDCCQLITVLATTRLEKRDYEFRVVLARSLVTFTDVLLGFVFLFFFFFFSKPLLLSSRAAVTPRAF